jgi:hypothetical protein
MQEAIPKPCFLATMVYRHCDAGSNLNNYDENKEIASLRFAAFAMTGWCCGFSDCLT